MNAVSDKQLLNAILVFYRNQIAARYELENIRRFGEFEKVTDEQVIALRDYFLKHIYPPVEQRDKLDRALDRLRDVLRSPKRLQPFMKAGLASMWKLGPNLPAAVKAGLAVLDTYHVAREMERTMVACSHDLGVTAGDRHDPESMYAIMRAVPEDQVMKLIGDINGLFTVLSNTKMLQTAVDFLGTCRGIMVKRTDLYDESDVNGITLGRAVVEGGLELFRSVDADVFPAMIAGIEQVELDWYYGVMDGANA